MSNSKQQAAAPSYLEMSDEDMMNATPPSMEAPATEEVKEEPKEEPVAEAPETEAEDTGTQPAEDGSDQDPDEASDAETDKPVRAEKPKATEEVEKPESPEKEEQKIDYEAAYKKLFAPFRANGREIQVQSVDDALALMQMGANYNKKMAGLKPNLKLMKMLENNNLLSEEKISYLIDLQNKNPEAINRLVKESGINPMDLDAEKAGEYKPKIHAVDDREIELDTVLDEIQDTPTYNRTLAIVSKEWDGASKQVVANHPQLLKLINEHVERGIYDLISKEVEQGRMLGRLNGLSDIEAYRQVGDAIQARGGFNHLSSSQGKSNDAGKVVTPKPKKADDSKLNEKRRAASPSVPATAGSANKDYNPLSLSDEEFNKLSTPIV